MSKVYFLSLIISMISIHLAWVKGDSFSFSSDPHSVSVIVLTVVIIRKEQAL